MDVVERHAFDAELFRASFEKARAGLAGYLQRRPVGFRLLLGLHAISWRAFGYGAALAPADPCLRSAARINAQACAGLLQALGGSSEPFPFGDEDVALAEPPPRGLDVTRVVEAQCFALLAEDDDARRRIAAAPEEALRSSAVRTDAFWWAWKRALDVAADSDPAEALARTSDALALSELAEVGQRAAIERARQVMQTFAALWRGERQAASAALVTLLEGHRAWSTRDDNDNLPRALASLPGSAALALARRRGLALDVRSDYLVTLGAG